MKKPIIILINGKAQSGKSELAKLIKEFNVNKNVSILHNADADKDICKDFFKWDEVKNEIGRRLLIDIANAGYNYDKYFWEKKTEEKIIMLYDDIVCIPDFRYMNTYEYFIKEGYDVKTIYISMDKDINHINNEIKKDDTEQKLNINFDYEIENTYGDLEKLKEYVRKYLIF